MEKPEIIDITLDDLLARSAQLKGQGWRFAQCCATAEGEGVYELLYSFCHDAESKVYNLRLHVTAETDEVPSVSGLFPCAFMFENEMHDLFGIKITGISIDYQGGFYHLHIPTPWAKNAEKAADKAPEKQEQEA